MVTLFDAVVEGNIDNAGALTQQALDTGMAPGAVLDRFLVPAMTEVGERFERGEYYIPHMLAAAQAMKTAMEILAPGLENTGAKPLAKVAIGTVKGDLHDIGKGLVASMLEGNGFDVLDLGMDVGPERFVSAINEHNVNIIAMSALLSTSMTRMKEVIDTLRREGLRDRVKIIIGGAPITQSFADEIGADGCSDNANGAVSLAKKLVLSN